ncbi:hypothetical protein KEM60_01524 [Austwickia sp. TVS 96-490-7B]|uniref:hypothetical protein n=1 Tax=Austwickia sp. TVS 96-490-7B TaxID=2830843 RepID=UPI001C5A26E0|nr:hypothetical protein [Austwickia sp. TVS 96-490-7B]MBW3085327.1 hypothetical protein [Austwickia sp. TVS 96-490-7B]
MLTGFLIIGGVGLGLLLVSLVVGEIFHGVIDALIPGDVISGAAVASFLSALGFIGALVLTQTENTALATAAGTTVGLGLAALATWMTRVLMHGDTAHNVNPSGFIGLHGTVINPIPTDGYGQVSIIAEGHITRLNARCEQPLDPGLPVTVIDVLSPTSVRVIARGPILPGIPNGN